MVVKELLNMDKESQDDFIHEVIPFASVQLQYIM